jgi:hypothetical protein
VGKDRRLWKPFVTECLMTFNAKPITYRDEASKVAFAASYLKDTALSHFTSLLQHNPSHPALRSWDAFILEFGRTFGIANTEIDAQQKLRALNMPERANFTNHIIRFEEYTYETGWNDAALNSELYRSLNARIKDIMRLTPRPTTYADLKKLAEQIDFRHWEHEAENNVSRIVTPHRETPTAYTVTSTACRDVQGASVGAKTDAVKPTAADTTRKPVSLEERTRRRNEGLCLGCGSKDHRVRDCTEVKVYARATFIIDGEEMVEDYELEEDEEPPDRTDLGNEQAIQELPGGP